MKTRLPIPLLTCLFALSILLGPRTAAADAEPSRLSLAISGGASKGAYEAGFIWGLIEVLRHVDKIGEGLSGGDPRPIEIASIAGTSAGGINSLLAALAWTVNPESEGGFANRIDDNILRDVWLTPDVNRLLPPEADSPLYLPDDALLSRKDLVTVARELIRKWRQPGTFPPGLRLTLGVTVTRVRPETMIASGVAVKNQRFYIPFELHTQKDGSAAFFFDPQDYPPLDDPAMILMPWPVDAQPFSVSDEQVIEALLTTSAFPAGFGRKRLQYCRQAEFITEEESAELPSETGVDVGKSTQICPDTYELAEAEFADGGLFDNLPIGLARLLSESSQRHLQKPLPVQYIYIDPDRPRYAKRESESQRACDGENPPPACRKLTYDLTSEAVVLGGAIGTARKYELFRELTGDNWRLNLAQLSGEVADIMDAGVSDVSCESLLPYFDGPVGCSDRLRHVGRLLDLTHHYRMTPINAPLSAQMLIQGRIARTCQPMAADGGTGYAMECAIDVLNLRKQLAAVLSDLTARVAPEDVSLRKRIGRSALSIDADRLLLVTDRGGPITGELLGAFGAFLEYKFREFDYYVGVYDAIMNISNTQCRRTFPTQGQHAHRMTCNDHLSKELYHLLGVADHPKARYVFARMVQQEFGQTGRLRFAYAPMPPEDRDFRIIFDGLSDSFRGHDRDADELVGVLPTERAFFEYLKAENFKPTPPTEGEKSLLAMIMEDPDFWSYELVNRATSRLIYLEQQADATYRAREPDPEKREKANTGLMGAGALIFRTATYKYPPFTLAPSTASEKWPWRYIIPYEFAFDFNEGDLQIFWQPTWNFKHANAGLRLGLGFTGGTFSSNPDERRENYGTLGLDLTRVENRLIFSGWGITPAVFHNWKKPTDSEQTTFGCDVHAYLLNNRLRISFGARDVIDNVGDTIFVTLGIADLPGLVYWLSR